MMPLRITAPGTCSHTAVSAIAETIRPLRGQTLDDRYFTRHRVLTRAIVQLEIADGLRVVDLDNPEELMTRRIRPSQVATRNREITQGIALRIFSEGATGMSWWSTLEAEWTNVTLFYERALPHATVVGAPRRLSTRFEDVRLAAERLGITIDA